MQVWHRITFSHRDDVEPVVERLNIKHKRSPLPGGGYLIHVDMNESNPHWPHLAALARQKNALDVFDTAFATREIMAAECVRLVPTFEQGYPQPEETWVTDPINYQVLCAECGTFKQTASFRIKSEPKLSQKDFMSLYWTYALFCTSEVLAALHAQSIEGYDVWDVLIHRTGMPAETVSQLYIPHVTNPGGVRVEDLQKEVCPSCNVVKSYPHRKGVMYFEREALVPEADIMQTAEWFGSGHSAYREILISSRFARLIIDQGWKGVTLKVVELV